MVVVKSPSVSARCLAAAWSMFFFMLILYCLPSLVLRFVLKPPTMLGRSFGVLANEEGKAAGEFVRRGESARSGLRAGLPHCGGVRPLHVPLNDLLTPPCCGGGDTGVQTRPLP